MKTNRKLFSLCVIGLSIIFYVSDSNSQENPPQSGQDPVISSFDPDEPPETRIRLTPSLTFGTQLEVEYEHAKNLDLDGAQDEDLSTLTPELSLAFSLDPSRHLQAFFDVKLSGELMYEDRDKVEDQFSLGFDQAYLLFKNLWNKRLSFQIGRQRFDDERQWLYDAELDAARAFFRLAGFLVELSVSREGLLDRDILNDDTAERVNNYIAYGTYAISEETYAAAYVVMRDDQSDEEDRPIFLGIQSKGDMTESLGYWLELAHVSGKEGANRIRGLGLDLGSTYVFDLLLEPSITLGCAFGTSDFRQTGLQANEGDFNGVADFNYYGVLFDPELSNLSIFTSGAGINPTEESSVDFVYHYYLQDKASLILRDIGIEVVPDGRSERLGSEMDLVIGYVNEGIKNNIELAFALGYFIPGKAFPPESENSFLTKFVVQFEY